MISTRSPFQHGGVTRTVLAALVAVGLSATARADDAKTQEIDAGGLKFEAPATWKSTPPQSQMRRAQLKIEPVKGDEDPAELIVFAFPGGAGTVDANVERWQRQFRDKEGNPPRAEVKVVKGKNVESTRVEIAGHYFPSNFPGQPKQPDRENYRLLGAIVLTDDTGYFLRLVGPEKTITAAKPAFDKLMESFKVEGK
ncbi:MAG: hypothetical protein U0794_18130 [Isosphaeraceae bacterium]